MRRPGSKSWIPMSVLCVLFVSTTITAQVPTNRPLYPGEQWVRLFNGKDLTNWVEVGKEKWTVEDGTIHGQGVTSAYGYLRTEKKYKDFWFSMRFKCEADGNSGLYFHTEFTPGTPTSPRGCNSRSIEPSTTTTPACMATGVNGSPGPRRNTSRYCAQPTGTTCS